MRGGWYCVLALVGCERAEQASAQPPGPTAAPEVEAVAVPREPEQAAEAESRACGEAGATPTELPPRLAEGRGAVGSGALKPGEALQIGKVALRYEDSAWIGTMKAGYRAPGLYVEIDRSEVGPHTPWGTLEEIRAGQAQTLVVGPYHVALRSGVGDPPAEIAVTVTREACPATAVIQPSATPTWFWVSSEAIRVHSYAVPQLVQVMVRGVGGAPRVDVTTASYRHWFEPRPGAVRSIRAGEYTLSFDDVTPGPGTRFAERWIADGEARVHVRGRVEPAGRASFPAASPASRPCGDPSPTREALPPGLDAAVKIADSRRIKPGEQAKLGTIALDYTMLEIPAHGQGPYREEAQQVPNLQVMGVKGGTSVGRLYEDRLLRIDDALVRVTGDGRGDALRVDRVALGCASELAAAKPTAPMYVWLSTRGRGYVRFGPMAVASLHLQVSPDAAGSLHLSSERGSLVRTLGPDLVGLGFTLDEYFVEVVDVREGAAGPGGLPPARHVQLRVTPGG